MWTLQTSGPFRGWEVGDAAGRLTWREGGGQVGKEGTLQEPLRSLRRGDSQEQSRTVDGAAASAPRSLGGCSTVPSGGPQAVSAEAGVGECGLAAMNSEIKDVTTSLTFPETNSALTPRTLSHQLSGKRRSPSLLDSSLGSCRRAGLPCGTQTRF